MRVLRGLPVVGNALAFSLNPAGFMRGVARRHHGLVGLHFGRRVLYFANDPALVRHVLNDNSDNYRHNFGEFRPIFGNSVIMATGERWRRLRRIAQPAFRSVALMRMSMGVQAGVDEALERMGAAGGHGFDLVHEANRAVVDCVARALFGAKLGDRLDPVARDMNIVVEATGRIAHDPFGIRRIFPGPSQRAYPQAVARLQNLCEQWLAARRGLASGQDDLLSRIVAATDGEPADLTRDEARDEVMTYLLAGFETTASTLAWTLLFVAENGELRDRLAAELRHRLCGSMPSYEQLAGLPLLGSMFQEVLRVWPSAWIISYGALDSDRLGAVSLPAGATVLVCPYAMHHRPDLWRQPDRFRPERFEGEETLERSSHAYIPFGGGGRTCIGARLARLIVMTMAAAIVQRGRLVRLGTRRVRPTVGVSLKPSGRITMSLLPPTFQTSGSSHRVQG